MPSTPWGTSADSDDAAPTQAGPTQLGPQVEAFAYSDELPTYDYGRASNVRVGLIAGGILAVAALVVGAMLIVDRSHRSATTPTTVAAPPTSAMAATVAPSATAHVPAPTSSLPPAAVTVPTRGGSAFVKTTSGKTVCQITAGTVACNVAFTRATPSVDGLPASGVSVTSRGNWQWLVGDPGDPEYTTLTYGVTFRVLGWTITPNTDGTTFMNDATGHGMTVSVDGFAPF